MTASSTVRAFATVNGQLAVGGMPLDRLAARVGSTPFFAYDRDLITARVQRLRTALTPRISLGYAVKANPMPAVVHHLSGLVDALDVASAGEMRVALDTPIGAGNVSFAGPGKTDAELTQAVGLRPLQQQMEHNTGRQGDMADQAAGNNEVHIHLRLKQTDAKILQAIDEALLRIEKGTFGICRDCGEPIAEARLNAIPWTRVCITCKEKHKA